MLYAIGDIHGRLDLVTKLYNAIREDIDKVQDSQGAEIIWLGDEIDRGPDSKGVLDFIMEKQQISAIKHVVLMGNHEDLMMRGMTVCSDSYRCWLNNGGNKTIKSFGFVPPYYVNAMQVAMQPYVDWIKTLPFYYTAYDYIFCHSGYIRTKFNNPTELDSPLDEQKQELIWGRPHDNMYPYFNKLIIHGHTPMENEIPYVEKNRINIDTAAWWSGSKSKIAYAVKLPHGYGFTENDASFIQVDLK